MSTQEDEYRGTYCVVGPPGCGKTHWLKLQAEAAVHKGYRPVICSLTKTAAAEIAGRNLPIPRDHVGTLHSLAYRAIGQGIVAESKIGEWNEERPEPALSNNKRPTADDPYTVDQVGNADLGDALLARYNVRRARMIPRAAWPQDVSQFADVWEQWVEDGGMVDFTGIRLDREE